MSAHEATQGRQQSRVIYGVSGHVRIGGGIRRRTATSAYKQKLLIKLHDRGGRHESIGGQQQMRMHFESSCEATILFQWWTTTNCTQYFFSCLFVAAVCIARHFMHDLRVSILADKATTSPAQEMQYLNPNSRSSKFDTFADHGHRHSHASQSHDGETPLSALARSRLRLPLGARLLWTLSFAINVTVSYLLMLVVMTFNTGLFAAVIVGESVGYFVWGTCVLHNIMSDGSHH